jgi:hypothetical protein
MRSELEDEMAISRDSPAMVVVVHRMQNAACFKTKASLNIDSLGRKNFQ